MLKVKAEWSDHHRCTASDRWCHSMRLSRVETICFSGSLHLMGAVSLSLDISSGLDTVWVHCQGAHCLPGCSPLLLAVVEHRPAAKVLAGQVEQHPHTAPEQAQKDRLETYGLQLILHPATQCYACMHWFLAVLQH
jgi:hypothetical protein